MYKFEVGIRELEILGMLSQTIGGNHAIFRLDVYDFEFGPKGVQITKRICKKAEYNWDYAGNEYKGYTNVSPIELANKIKESKLWESDKYNVFTNNCHNFMLFCFNFCSGNNKSKALLCIPQANKNAKVIFKRVGNFFGGFYEIIYDIFN